MSYLTIEKSELINLEQSLFKELLRTNRAGSYSSSSIIGCNTRKYHGLLVCPIAKLNMTRSVLLSSLDITVIQHEKEFNLGIHKYPGNNYEPKGHKYLRRIDFEDIPYRVYRVGGVKLAVEELLVHKEEQILVKITLLEANSKTSLKLKPLLANRSVHELTHENMDANTKYEKIDKGISTQMYESHPRLFMQLSKDNEFIAMPHWNKNIEYIKEKERGYEYLEDLFVPGFFEIDIKKGESIVFSASTSIQKPYGFKRKFTKEYSERIPRDSFYNNLLNAAQQFLVASGKNIHMIAGYHWYGVRMRDNLIAIPALSEALKNPDLYKNNIETVAKRIKTKLKIKANNSLSSIDTMLWFFWSLQQNKTDLKVWDKYEKLLKEIINSYLNNAYTNVIISDDYLLYSTDETKPLTWMNSIAYGKAVTLRKGACVEVNALWYNALMMTLELAQKNKDTKWVKKLTPITETLKESYISHFWNTEKKCLFDVIDGSNKDASVRPNQIIGTSFIYTPLNKEQKKNIIDIAKKELLNSKGLRSLSPADDKYKGRSEGNINNRDLTIHQGASWPWIISFYAETYFELHKKSGISHLKQILENFETELDGNCLGTISEYYDGNPPHKGKGAVSMAWNVAAILKLNNLIEENS